MVEAYLAADARFDRRFYLCVRTTKIYCMPSCKARKPKPENVEFVETVEEAVARGFRACKRCKPDIPADETDFADATVQAVWADPSKIVGATELQRVVGKKSSALAEWTRLHVHRTPLQWLNEAKVQLACRLLRSTSDSVGDIALEAGFESSSAFYEQFARYVGMTPNAYRGLGKSSMFVVDLPVGHASSATLKTLGRDPLSPTERATGNEITFSTPTGLARARVGEFTIECACTGDAFEAHQFLRRAFGLGQDVEGFIAATKSRPLGEVATQLPGLRVPMGGNPYESLVWSIVGQQISLPFAYSLRQRLYGLVGRPFGDGFFAPLTPDDVAKLDVSDLLPHQFSGRKAEYLIDISRSLATGKLDLDLASTRSAVSSERELLAVRGLGPWSVNYVMMRGLGFSDCLPLGDTGINAGLRKLHGIDRKLTPDEVVEYMEPYRPFRSLASYTLWQSLSMQG